MSAAMLALFLGGVMAGLFIATAMVVALGVWLWRKARE